MSLQSWSTLYEQRWLNGDLQTRCNIIVYFSVVGDKVSDTSNDLSSLSSSSSESSASSLDNTQSSDSSSYDEFKMIGMSIECILFWAHRVHTKIQKIMELISDDAL